MQATSARDSQTRPVRKIAGMQHWRGPPGRLEQPCPPHSPHVALQQTWRFGCWTPAVQSANDERRLCASSGLAVRLRRWWVTRRCASADGEKDEKDENISGAGRRPPAVTRKFSNDHRAKLIKAVHTHTHTPLGVEMRWFCARALWDASTDGANKACALCIARLGGGAEKRNLLAPSPWCCKQRRATTAYRLPVPLGTPPLLNV